MAFVPEKAKEAQAKQFDGEWKVCRRSGCEVLMVHPQHPDVKREHRQLENIERRRLGLTGNKADRPLPDEVREEIMARLISRRVLKDWRKVEEPDGTPIKFSESVAYSSFKEIVSFQMDILELINSMSDEEAAEQEAISGNS